MFSNNCRSNRLIKIIIITSMVFTFVSIARNVSADPALTINTTDPYGGGLIKYNVIGWQFDVFTSITVTGLGWWSGGGFYDNNVNVALWDSAGNMIASSGRIGVSNTLLDGLFRIRALSSPITLQVGDGYVIGGSDFSEIRTAFVGTTDFTVDPRINWIGYTETSSPGLDYSLTMPNRIISTDNGLFGPSFSVSAPVVVPEPISALLFIIGGTFLVGNQFFKRDHNKSYAVNADQRCRFCCWLFSVFKTVFKHVNTLQVCITDEAV